MVKDTKPRKIKKKILTSRIVSIVSITLVLLMLGALGFLLFTAGRLSDHLREKIGFTLVLQDNLSPDEITSLQKKLNTAPYVKFTRYIDKETAANEFAEELGEDFIGFLGYNPLFSSMEVKLFAPYTVGDSLVRIENRMLAFPEVTEVYYQKDLVYIINENTGRIGAILLLLSALLILICIALISNTIRISVYSKRFSINTMQLVGASDSFIRRPYLERSLYWGAYAALAANLILITGYISIKKELTGEIIMEDLFAICIVFSLVILSGICISFISTWISVNKFLKLKFDELFY